ncbi:hypothetical protein L596_002599 [Steinernema carpocapsae]|uniref:CLIC N-terminal domain-containing protein n=1 Tax=Steinernema carpocapsae TaxID=34508 RepID=A0A4U8URK5_STECR|nr:hypothetical protein L596_002599 [Steinernema carpocapsae]
MSNPLELWLRAGSDGERLGGDPLAHQLFMMLLLKSQPEDSALRFTVLTVNEAKPPPKFREAGFRRSPALQHGEDVALSYEDEIVEYVENTFPYPSLKHVSGEADNVTADLFRVFCFFIKEVSNDPKALTNELIRIDRYLGENETDYLTANEMKLIDCTVLSRLHSIRITCKALKEFEIPVDLHNLWNYMENGYNNSVFAKSCPSDQEIILYWAERPDTPNLLSSQKRSQLCRQRPLYTLVVPKDGRKSQE